MTVIKLAIARMITAIMGLASLVPIIGIIRTRYARAIILIIVLEVCTIILSYYYYYYYYAM